MFIIIKILDKDKQKSKEKKITGGFKKDRRVSIDQSSSSRFRGRDSISNNSGDLQLKLGNINIINLIN